MRQMLNSFCGVALVCGLASQSIQAATPIEDCFKMDWTQILYNKDVTIDNPKVGSQTQASQIDESLRLLCQIEVSDPNRVMGISRQATVTQMFDSKGQGIPLGAATTAPIQRYNALHYRPELVGLAGPQMVERLQPSMISLDLDKAVLQAAQGEILRIEGYFYALTMDSVEYVDVPFEPNSTWIRLAPGQEVCILEALSTPSDYRFTIRESSQGRPSSSDLAPGKPLPARIAIGRLILGPNGKVLVGSRNTSSLLSLSLAGGTSASGTGAPAKTIRFVIAVNPKHSKIPFVLEHIPLPKP